MNVEVRIEAHLDIAEGVAFYDRQGYVAGDYFYQRIFEDIDSLSETGGIHERHFGYHRKIASRHPFLIYYRMVTTGVTRPDFKTQVPNQHREYIQYLLSQNCTHFANATELTRIYKLLNELGLSGMLVCAPIEFFGGS
jgi:hypothetical protein